MTALRGDDELDVEDAGIPGGLDGKVKLLRRAKCNVIRAKEAKMERHFAGIAHKYSVSYRQSCEGFS
jgi:hypothetical protein